MDGCSKHNREFEFICFDCNVLLCSECVPRHRHHLFDHQPAIISDIQLTIKTTFDSLKSAVIEYQQNRQTEDEISNRFKELHEFLVLEEHKLKKPIIDNKEQLEQQIESQTTIMRSLNLMNHQLNKIISDSFQPNPQSKATTTSYSSSISSLDTTDSYQTSTIITSISKCLNHDEFIQNNNTLFNLNYDHRYSNTKNDDHILLNLLLEHNNTLRSYNHFNVKHNQLQQYRLNTNYEQLNQIKNQLQSTFKLVSQPKKQSNKKPYILSTANSKISVIDITDQNNIRFTQQDITTIYTNFNYYSCVIVGNHFYNFGGGMKVKTYFRYSIDNQTFEEIEMKGIKECGFVSVCYDDKNHIYLMDGFNRPKLLIYRFNIINSTFEEYSTAKISSSTYHHFTFHFNNCIYSYIPFDQKILKFDIKIKATFEISIKLPRSRERAACTDGRGNMFVLSDTGFHQINIETNEIKQLDRSTYNLTLIYHLFNKLNSKILVVIRIKSLYLLFVDSTNCLKLLNQQIAGIYIKLLQQKSEKQDRGINSIRQIEKVKIDLLSFILGWCKPSIGFTHSLSSPTIGTSIDLPMRKSRNSITYCLGTCGRPTQIRSSIPRSIKTQ
ncbi:hypothetical protein PPL_08303 [Heterostelium album PN500]|uniref:B box-type domain-containing protein n=1 Tax=Heterostelium pallidum (strain ATCC 26659 / Pp 5 / PN500) TaxID=670386 RepID=D3BHT8_HETP5|nr:hypothetical protein PPL_08303 [Heterostelium album PN500]EFA78838.1 hypothetical protein PPL_08303 [Heterostelium album PN500]|eukprot:XP_020430962.1 hypothetical protein PPL_08303 [Heterostelium album PN500]